EPGVPRSDAIYGPFGATMSTKLGDGQYYGRVLRRRAVAGLILTETHYAPFARVPRHAHANAYVCLVRRGSFTEPYGRRTRTCGPARPGRRPCPPALAAPGPRAAR